MLPPRKHHTAGQAAQILRLSSRSLTNSRHRPIQSLRGRVHLITEACDLTAPAGTTLLVVQSETPQFSYQPPGLLQGLIEGAHVTGCRLEMAIVADNQLDNEPGLRALMAQTGASGLLFNYQMGYPRALPELIERMAVPALWINSPHRTDCVVPDDYAAAIHLTRHLIALGHRRIAYADLTNDFTADVLHHSCLERLDGYKQAMQEAGYSTHLIGAELPLDEEEQLELISATFAATPAPSAVITYCPRSVLPIYRHALSELHLRVPEDLGLATFVNDEHEIAGIDVTRMANPWHEVGHAAITRLVARCTEPQNLREPLILPMPLIEGSTCRPRQGTGRITRN